KEDHGQAMRGGEHIVFMRTREKLNARILQLHADRDRQRRADHARDDREHQVHGPDVFVIRRIDVTPPSGRMTVRLVSFVSAVCCRRASHRLYPSTFLPPPVYRPRQSYLTVPIAAIAFGSGRVSPPSAYFFFASTSHAE